jgi:serine/threonine-protein kinase
MWPAWSRHSAEIFYQDSERRVMTAAYTVTGDSFVAEKPRVWSEKRLAQFGYLSSFELAPDAKRVVALFDAAQAKPETHLRVLLNVGDELRRRTAAK